MVTEKMINDEEIKLLLDLIRESNDALYDTVMLKLTTGISLRKDVLEYLAENAAEFDCGDDYLFNIVTLMEDKNVSPEWYGFLNNYHKNVNKIGICDLIIIISDAVQENIDFERFKSLFDENETDVFAILNKFNGVAPSEDTIVEAPTDTDKEKNEISEVHQQTEIEGSTDEDIRHDSPVDVFDNLIDIISDGRERQASIVEIQKQFNEYTNSLQGYVRNLSVFMNDIIREWENDKVQIARLKGLYEIERRLMAGQQEKIASLQNELNSMASKIKAAEKSEYKRQEMEKKLAELQTLAQQEDGLIAMSFPENV